MPHPLAFQRRVGFLAAGFLFGARGPEAGSGGVQLAAVWAASDVISLHQGGLALTPLPPGTFSA